MDTIIITAAVILGVITIIEVLTYFYILPEGGTPDSVAVLPVFADDRSFPQRIERLTMHSRSPVILVDYTADTAQKELCERFVRNHPDAVFISQTEIEKIFAETFAFRDEI